MKIRAVIFDFDGTLAPSLPLWMEAFQYALRFYNQELTDGHLFTKYFYQPFQVTVEECGITDLAEFATHLQKGYFTAFTKIELYPGVHDLLKGCKREGIALALVTCSPRTTIDFTLNKLGISDYFEAIIAGDEVKQPKPDPESILLALQRLGKLAGEALVVGDYSNDILVGKAAKTHTALFLPAQHNFFYNFEELRATGPDLIFSDYIGLQQYLFSAASLDSVSGLTRD